MALCRVLCMDFIANGAIGETDEMGNARYSQEDITEGIQYADWLLGDGYTKEPFYHFDLVRFKRWCIKKNPPARMSVGFMEGSNNTGGNIMLELDYTHQGRRPSAMQVVADWKKAGEPHEFTVEYGETFAEFVRTERMISIFSERARPVWDAHGNGCSGFRRDAIVAMLNKHELAKGDK